MKFVTQETTHTLELARTSDTASLSKDNFLHTTTWADFIHGRSRLLMELMFLLMFESPMKEKTRETDIVGGLVENTTFC
jgi:hypothetical protein